MTQIPPKDIRLTALSLGGDAVARAPAPPSAQKEGEAPPATGGQVVFVPFGAPGDHITLNRWESKRSFARAWIESVQDPSPDRVDAPCPYYFRPGADPLSVCGGCDWQHLRYAAQAKAKRDLLIEAFQRIGKIARPQVGETIVADVREHESVKGSSTPSPSHPRTLTPSPTLTPSLAWRYRNKVQIPFAMIDGKLTGGFYAPGSHRVVPFDDCLVQNDHSVAVFKAVLSWFRANPVSVYDEQAKSGWLRHLLIRTNAAGDAMVALVTHAGTFANALAFVKQLTEKFPYVKSVFQNVNPKPGSVVLGPEWRHLHGKHHLPETLMGMRFRLSPGTFFQIHHAMAEKLYKQVETFVDPAITDSVLELYAGVGAIAQLLARRAKFVWGVEENAQAVEDANESAKWNALRNVRFQAARCEDAIARGRFRKGQSDDLAAVVLDPPRAGCEQHVLRGVIRLKPRKIVYVSCDPGTLARDARYLATGGYLLRNSVPVDLFPQTSHIESVSMFTKTS